jgi:hypothetical protein
MLYSGLSVLLLVCPSPFEPKGYILGEFDWRFCVVGQEWMSGDATERGKAMSSAYVFGGQRARDERTVLMGR